MPAQDTEHYPLDLTDVTSVEVATFNGLVSVVTGEEPPRLVASVSGSATYEVERLGTLLYIAAKKHGFTYGGAGVGIRLWLPPGLALKLSTVAAPVHVRGPVRSLTATTYQGDILTEETGQADLRLKAAASTIAVRGAGGRVDVSLSHGDVRIDGSEGDVRVASGRGKMTISQTRGRVHLSSGHSDMLLSGVTGQIHLATGLGSITIEGVEGEVHATTGAGALRLERVTFAPGSRNWLTSGTGPAEMRSISAPGGMRVSVKPFKGNVSSLDLELPGYSIQLDRSRLRAELPGTRPARLEIVAPLGVHIGR